MLEAFDADQLLAVQRRDKGEARVEAAVAQAVVALLVLAQFADDHGAGAAVTTGAALFGAGFAQVLAQVLQHRHVRVQGVLTMQLLLTRNWITGIASQWFYCCWADSKQHLSSRSIFF